MRSPLTRQRKPSQLLMVSKCKSTPPPFKHKSGNVSAVCFFILLWWFTIIYFNCLQLWLSRPTRVSPDPQRCEGQWYFRVSCWVRRDAASERHYLMSWKWYYHPLVPTKRLCIFCRRCVVWGAQQSPVQFQRTAALAGGVSPAGPSACPPEGNSPTQHTVCLRHGHIHRYFSFTLQNVGYHWFGRLVLTFRWFVRQVVGDRHQKG